MIDFDELRKEVAIRHNLLLTPNDPVLVTLTLNELVLARYVEILTAQNEQHLVALNLAMNDHIAKAKDTGAKVITTAAGYVSDEVSKSVTSMTEAAGAKLTGNLAEAKEAAKVAAAEGAAIQAMRKATLVSAGVAAAAALISVVVLLVVLFK